VYLANAKMTLPITDESITNNVALLYEHFPELYKHNLKLTHRKQWDRFIIAFSFLCLWVHTSRAKHKHGAGIVLFPGWWGKYLLNCHRWHFDVIHELEPFITTDGHYNYKTATSRCWIPSIEFVERSARFICDERFHTTGYWLKVVKDVILQYNIKPLQQITRSTIQIDAIHTDVIKPSRNIESYLIVKAFADKLHNGFSLDYSVANTSRLHHPLQNIKKADRKILFADWYSYDFRACAPTVLAQEYYKLVPDSKLPSIDLFIENRIAIRNEIASQTGISSQNVKRALTGLFFGQTVPSTKQAQWDIQTTKPLELFKFSLINTFGPIITQKLLNNELFISIVEECQSKVFKELSKSLRQKAEIDDQHRYQLTNLSGGVRTMNKWNAKKAVAHWYFGIERLLIDVVSSKLDEMGASYLLIHDGFISNVQINKKEMQDRIRKMTGYDVQLIEEKEEDSTRKQNH
jgi:hypothetical protein